MYVTKPLSQLLKSPDSVSLRPEGPNSGYLVIQDEESETYSCFGLCKNRTLKDLPFPQNKELTVQYTTSSGESSTSYLDPVLLIPVLNQPLSSNLYYAIDPHKKHKGEAFTCSREEDKTTCCFCRCIKDVKPKPLDPQNIYQQFEIVPYPICGSNGAFVAKSIASDGFPPTFLRRKGWSIYTKTPDYFKLEEARGLDSKLRAQLPDINSSPIVVGKWYCPFMFVKEGTLKDQVKRSMYYEMTLEQRWEQVFACKNINRTNSVAIDVLIEKEEVFVGGNKASWNDKNVVHEVISFTSNGPGGGQMSVGLRQEIVQRMKWEQERFGWVGGEERQVKINKVEECKDFGEWNEFGCYVLVERFNLKRMDGSLVMAYDFKHYSLSLHPEGPNSGYLVIQDKESETYSCFGLFKNHTLNDLPFPQNKELSVQYAGVGMNNATEISLNPVLLIPVLNQPLSSNLYYAIEPHGKHKGKAFTCSKEEDKATCCFCRFVRDVKSKPVDPHNIYQQFKIVPHTVMKITSGFFGESIARDGFPPYFFRRKGWSIRTKTPKHFKLDEARGLNSKLRAQLPDINSPIVVGKWYCPFMFVREGKLKDQVKKSMYYEMTLEQRWEQVFACKNNQTKSVVIDALIEKEEVFIGGINKATWNEKNVVDEVIWFTRGRQMSVGLRQEIVQRMKWEQERFGWLSGGERQMKINKVEKFEKSREWHEFGCYVLVERFNLKRMDGSLVMAYDFKHCHQMKTIWT
ncbi:hypothetical protein ACJIZ3_020066 [Penstemon smallii]|uniref:Uncharacterized protein n=1 Tax=Penstemon smallii TaxID=265156 RepID=A0ABD3SHU6_9LAMI